MNEPDRWNSMTQRMRQRHDGSAAIALVLILALVVGTFSASVGRRAVHERRQEQQRITVATLQSAIDAVAQAKITPDAPLKLPLDDVGDRWIIVEVVSDTSDPAQWRATLFQNDQSRLSIRRPMVPPKP